MINRFYKWFRKGVYFLMHVKKSFKVYKKKVLCEFHVKELSRKFCNNLIKWPYDSRKTHLGLSNGSPCVLWFAEEKNKKNPQHTELSISSPLRDEKPMRERTRKKEMRKSSYERSISRDKACSCNHQKSSLDFIFLLTLWKQRLVIRGDSFQS